jgi:endonuclease-3
MSSPSRTAQFVKLQKTLKKIYQPVALAERSVLEQLLFACCLENAPYDKAEEAFAALVHTFFDWNEIRVTTVKELSEVMAGLPDPPLTANHIKRILQNVFETTYKFDLEDLRKKNLGVAVEKLEKLNGASRFSVAYVVQAALGGHSIPIDSGTLEALKVVDMISDEDFEKGEVAGLERAIPKNKGVEFGSMLHQLGADFAANPYASSLHKTLLQINPEAEARLPKRRPKEPKPEAGPAETKGQPPKTAEAKPEAKPKGRPRAEAAEPPAPIAAGEADPDKAKGKAAKKKAVETEKPLAAVPAEPMAHEPPAKKKPAATKKSPEVGDGAEGRAAAKKATVAASAGLSKKKPR